MNKLIIRNESGYPADEILALVSRVIADGRISDGGYCFATTWPKLGVAVYAIKNKASDTFLVRNME